MRFRRSSGLIPPFHPAISFTGLESTGLLDLAVPEALSHRGAVDYSGADRRGADDLSHGGRWHRDHLRCDLLRRRSPQRFEIPIGFPYLCWTFGGFWAKTGRNDGFRGLFEGLSPETRLFRGHSPTRSGASPGLRSSSSASRATESTSGNDLSIGTCRSAAKDFEIARKSRG